MAKANTNLNHGLPCVYSATCAVNGWQYVGQTRMGFAKRKVMHEQASQNRNSKSYWLKFSTALREHGVENFTWEILHFAPDDDTRCLLEKLEIATRLKDGRQLYNSTSGGERGFVFTPEVRAKLSARLRAYWAVNKRKPHPPEVIEKIRAANTGSKRTPEQIERIREAQKNKIHTQKLKDYWTRMSRERRDSGVYKEVSRKMKENRAENPDKWKNAVGGGNKKGWKWPEEMRRKKEALFAEKDRQREKKPDTTRKQRERELRLSVLPRVLELFGENSREHQRWLAGKTLVRGRALWGADGVLGIERPCYYELLAQSGGESVRMTRADRRANPDLPDNRRSTILREKARAAAEARHGSDSAEYAAYLKRTER